MLDRFRVKLLSMPRRWKRLLQVATDILLVWLSLWLAFVVRLGTDDMIDIFGEHAWLFIAAPLIAIPLFIRFGMYRAVMRYLGNDALIAIAKAVTISALVLSLVVYWYRGAPAPVPRSLVFNYWWLSMPSMHLIKSALFLILFACLPFSASAAPAAAKPPVVATTPTEASTAEVVNINTADEATLVRGLNGVGEVKAKAIVEYRTAHGPFVSLDQLLEVKGVGPALLEKNRERIAIE